MLALKMLIRHLWLPLALTTFSSPGWAVFPTPSAFDITGPGGFAAACAALNSGSGNIAPHMAVSGGLFLATSSCAGQTFTGLGSASTPVVEWTTVQASAQAQTTQGWVSLYSDINRPPYVGSFPGGRANGGFADQLTVPLPNQQGQSGHLLAGVNVSGQLSAQGSAGIAFFSVIALKNKQGLPDGALGLQTGTATVAGSQLMY